MAQFRRGMREERGYDRFGELLLGEAGLADADWRWLFLVSPPWIRHESRVRRFAERG